jgi:Surface-adhesin protein E
MKSARFAAIALLMAATMTLVSSAIAADWVEVGADTQAKYYVDVDSIEVDGENVRVLKRGVFTQVLTDTLGSTSATFKETIGIVEIDCARRINRITRIDMIGENGEVVWSSGPMKKRMWEDVRPNTHAETTVEVVCGRIKKS